MTIGITIKTLLDANAALLALVPSARIFPYIANEKTALPLIIYTVDSLDPSYDKDGWIQDNCNFSVVSFSEDYANLQLIVTQVREALELEKTSATRRIVLTGQQEGYNINEGVFLNKLTFSVDIFDY
jgi:hypothetical protein